MGPIVSEMPSPSAIPWEGPRRTVSEGGRRDPSVSVLLFNSSEKEDRTKVRSSKG